MKNKSLTDDLNRIMLVLAIVIGAVFAYFCVMNTGEAVHIKKTTATIVEVYYDYTYPNEPNNVHYSLKAEFTADGQVYSKTLTVTSATPLKDGDTLEISYDDQEPEKYVAPFSAYLHNILVSAFAVAACIFCLFYNKKYFKGYYTDFILKHKKAVIFTLIDVLATAVMLAIAIPKANAPDLVGFEGLGIAVFAIVWTLIAAIALIVVWTVAVVKSAKQYTNETLTAQYENADGSTAV